MTRREEDKLDETFTEFRLLYHQYRYQGFLPAKARKRFLDLGTILFAAINKLDKEEAA